jgi:hypothetical protein
MASPARAPATSGGRPTGQQRPLPARPQAAAVSSSSVRAAVVQGPPRVTLGTRVAPEEVDLSSGELRIPEAVAQGVEPGKDLDLKVRLPGLAEGALRVRKQGEAFGTAGAQAILLRHPALARFAAANPTVLALTVRENRVTGFVGLGTPGPVKGNDRSLVAAMAKGAELLNWAGLSNLRFPTVRNRFEGGVIDLAAENLSFTVGGFLSGTGSVALDNRALSFEGSAKLSVPGGSSGELLVKQDPAGELSGRLEILVALGSVAGTVVATLAKGFVSILGQVAYSGDRLSGKVTLVATDEATARDVTLAKPSAGGDVPIELPGPDRPPKPGKRAFCGWGQLTFRVTDWLAGTATVIVNSKGQATIVGEIAPPKEFILFEQKEWIQRIFKVEVKAGYGIPVVGQVGLFANIGLDAIAKIGPGKLYGIKLSGAYSTDPRVAKNLTIEGTLNISAFAGLRLRAEAGLVVTFLGHDIKAGAGVNGIAGVRGYVEATPRIGMRELAPGGKREYFIQGHLEIAAQPVLGFSGDLFVAIETPWWSPLSDKRWTWPLFSIEYPLPGEFGIGADVDYVLGSKKWPSIKFGEVNFDSSKFMTDLMNDNTDKGSGKEQKKPADWAEGPGAKGKGGAKNKGGAGKSPAGEEGIEPVGEEETFSDGGETHKLWFEVKGADAKLMMASTNPADVAQKIKEQKQLIPLLVEDDQKRANKLVQDAEGQLTKLDDLADRLASMNLATRKAKEVYERNKGKKRSKGKKGKSGSRELSQKIKAEQRKLRETLMQLATLTRAIPFTPINLHPPMHGGVEELSIVDDKKTAGLRIAKRKGAGKYTELQMSTSPLVNHAVSQGGLNRVKKDTEKIEQQEKKIEKVPAKGGKVNARNHQGLKETASRVAAVVSAFGSAMKVPSLHRARQFLPVKLGEGDGVKFTANPAKVGKGLYRRQFLKNMREQLREQQRGIRNMSADEWMAQRALFSMDAKAFRAFDTSGREELSTELTSRAVDAKNRANRYLGFLKKWITEQLSKVNRSDDELAKTARWLRLLDRAEERRANAYEILLELESESRGEIKVPSPEILKANYKGTTEPMRQRVLGRQDQEKRVRKRHQDQLDDFLKYQTDWSELAKTGSDLAILHRPDQVGGGFDRFEELPVPPGEVDLRDPRWKAYYAGLRKMFGPKKVNEAIGIQWKGQVEKVPPLLMERIQSRIAYPIHRMNLTLKILPSEQ